jgi:serine/threonine-protein kinase RsbW
VLIDCSLPATPQNVALARRMLDDVTMRLGLSDDDRAHLKLALSEACTNAVQHGSPRGSDNAFHVRCELREQRLIVEVQDEGAGFDFNGTALPDPYDLTSSGRGLFLMQYLVDALELIRRPDGMVVRLVKALDRSCEE